MNTPPGESLAALVDNLDALTTRFDDLTDRIVRRTDYMLSNPLSDVSNRRDALLASQQVVIKHLRAGHVHIAQRQHSPRQAPDSPR